MTEIEIKATYRPSQKRKLTSTHQVKLFKHAANKFIDGAARVLEDQAYAAMVAGIQADYHANLEPHLASLELFVFTTGTGYFTISEIIPVKKVVKKQFTLPNGDVVDRESEEIERLDTYWPRDIEVKTINYLRQYVATGRWESSYETRRPDHGATRLSLEKLGIKIISYGAYHDYGLLNERTDRATSWVSQETRDLVIAHRRAALARSASEDNLRRAIGALILKSAYFSDLTSVWPEANEIAEDLFAEVVKPDRALIISVITDEQRALLCGNMSSRGVDSDLCAIAA